MFGDVAIHTRKVNPIQSGDLTLLEKHQQSDKEDFLSPQQQYSKYYRKYFHARRRQKLQILVIGSSGSTLKMWASYFTNSSIFGIDASSDCRSLCAEFENIDVLIGDAKNFDFENRIFNIIIYKGSSLAADITATWQNLQNNVAYDTTYVIQDIHLSANDSYLEKIHSKDYPNVNWNKWKTDNGHQRTKEFFKQISDKYSSDIYEDKIAFVIRRDASGQSGDDITFSFGENWLDFIDGLDQDALESSVADIDEWLEPSWVQSKSVIDIGSGSGLSSLSFKKAGCGDLFSMDVDPKSVAATTKLAKVNPEFQSSWEIRMASILDEAFVECLPSYDIVYSWGVLHHTGQMWKSINNAARLCKPGGLFWISIYSGGHRYGEDLELKQTFNAADEDEKHRMIQSAILQEKARLKGIGCSPENWNRNQERGMNVYSDMVDWLGGLPYEVARVSEVLVFLQQRWFTPLRVLEERQGGCSIYLFKKLSPKGFADYSEHTFIYNCTWSDFTSKRTIMHQITHEFLTADSMYCDDYDQLSKTIDVSISRAIEAEARLNSGVHIARSLLQWLKRRVLGR